MALAPGVRLGPYEITVKRDKFYRTMAGILLLIVLDTPSQINQSVSRWRPLSSSKLAVT